MLLWEILIRSGGGSNSSLSPTQFHFVVDASTSSAISDDEIMVERYHGDRTEEETWRIIIDRFQFS